MLVCAPICRMQWLLQSHQDGRQEARKDKKVTAIPAPEPMDPALRTMAASYPTTSPGLQARKPAASTKPERPFVEFFRLGLHSFWIRTGFDLCPPIAAESSNPTRRSRSQSRMPGRSSGFPHQLLTRCQSRVEVFAILGTAQSSLLSVRHGSST